MWLLVWFRLLQKAHLQPESYVWRGGPLCKLTHSKTANFFFFLKRISNIAWNSSGTQHELAIANSQLFTEKPTLMKSYQWPAQMPHDPGWSRCISVAHSSLVSIQHPHCSGIYTTLLKYLSAHSRIANLSKQKAPESGSLTQKNKCMLGAATLLESVCIPVNKNWWI